MNIHTLPVEITKSIINNSVSKIFENGTPIEYKFGCVLEVSSKQITYNIFNKLIYQLDKEKYTENRFPTASDNFYMLNDNISYWVQLKTKKDFMYVKTYRIDSKDDQSSSVQYIRVVLYGPNRKKIRKSFYEKMCENKTDVGKILVANGYVVNHIRSTSFEHIVLDPEIQRRLITSLYYWEKNKQWYLDHNLMHKIGILLYGLPGTGKSTVIRAISDMFNRASIFMVETSNIYDSIGWIYKRRAITNGVLIVVIEDIDLLCTSREFMDRMKDDYYYMDNKNKELNALFQLLDGALTPQDTIFVATTNYKDRLDPALIRHGRFDVQIEMKPFNQNQAKTFIKDFGCDEKILEDPDITYPITPATLQAKVLEYKSRGGK